MNPFPNTPHLRALLLMLATLPACTTLDRLRAHQPDPDARLDALLELREPKAKSRDHCQEIWDADHAIVDCQRVQREIDRLYAEFPENERILMANAVVQYADGRRESAQFLLDQLLSKPGSHPDAAILRSRIAFAEGNTNRARTLLKTQIKRAPDNAELHETLAAAYYLEGKYAEAENELRVATILGAPQWRVAYHQGLVQEALGRADLACTDYHRAIHLKPDFRAAMARIIGLSEQPECADLTEALESYRRN